MDEVCDWLLKFKDLKVRQISAVGVITVIWGIWKIRNKACFQNILPVDPNGVVSYISQLQLSWIALQRRNLRKFQTIGAKLLVLVASEFFHKSRGWALLTRRLN
jgi:hypothetical protein